MPEGPEGEKEAEEEKMPDKETLKETTTYEVE
jgi:hypothetical protein